MKHSINIVIYGCGALASLFAARLSKYRSSGDFSCNVTMFGHWQEHLEKIRRQGLYVTGQNGEGYIEVDVTSQLDELPAADIAIVLVKSWQTQQTARIVAQNLAADGNYLTLQNGLGNFETLAGDVTRSLVFLTRHPRSK